MKKIVHKVFWAWEFDREEKWLNSMSAKGLALTSVGFCRYEFEDCTPGEYKFFIELLSGRASGVENVKYIEFLEDAGVKHVGTYGRWVYFRGKPSEENDKLFSDNASRIKHLTRIIRFIAVLLAINLYFGCYNLLMYFQWHSPINYVGILSFAVVIFGATGIARLMIKRKKLKAETQIFE